MHTTRTHGWTTATTITALATLSLLTGPSLADASGGHSGGDSSGRGIVRAALVGSMPAPASPTIAKIKPGGAPWVNGPSEVRVGAHGWITVTIRGLVIPPPVGTGVNPVASVVATLVCGRHLSSTAPFALSTAGDGSTVDRVSVRGRCDDPTVLIQPAGNRAVYIASTQDDDDRSE